MPGVGNDIGHVGLGDRFIRDNHYVLGYMDLLK